MFRSWALAVWVAGMSSLGVLAHGMLGGPWQPQGAHQWSGKLVSLEPSRGVLQLQASEGRVRLKVDAATTVFVNGRFATLQDLQLGAHLCATAAASSTGKRVLVDWIEPCEPKG